MTNRFAIASAIALSDEDFKLVQRERRRSNPEFIETRRRILEKARAARKRRTKCVRGHSLTKANVRMMKDGERRCRKCENIRAQTWRDRQKERKK